MAINSAIYTGPGGAQTVSMTITPQHATDVAFAVVSFQNIDSNNNLVLNVTGVAAASGGNTVYTIDESDGGASNGYLNKVFVCAGLQTANVGTFICVASTTTTVTLRGSSVASACVESDTDTPASCRMRSSIAKAALMCTLLPWLSPCSRRIIPDLK